MRKSNNVYLGEANGKAKTTGLIWILIVAIINLSGLSFANSSSEVRSSAAFTINTTNISTPISASTTTAFTPTITRKPSTTPTAIITDTSKITFTQAQTPTSIRTSTITSCLAKSVDVVLVIDRSGSMQGQPMEEAQRAARNFIELTQLQSDQVGLVSFSDSARLDQQLMQSESVIKQGIDNLQALGETNIASGIAQAQMELTSSRHNPLATRVMILLSDGRPTAGNTLATAQVTKQAGIRIITIGLGSQIDEDLMRSIASVESDYYPVPDASDLVTVYQAIARTLNCVTPIRTPIFTSTTASDTPVVHGQSVTTTEDTEDTPKAIIPSPTNVPVPPSTFSSWTATILGILVGVIVTFLLTPIYQRFIGSALPIAYNIAVLGFRGAGKTTIITSLFGEIFARKVTGVGFEATLTGKNTIERLNKNLERLQRGFSLGPTTDQDMFAFRTNIRQKRFLFQRTYKVEIGDFDGKDSEKYTEETIDWLHDQPLFKWAVDADGLIFIIDMGKYLNPKGRKDYIARMTSAIRAAWQNFVDSIEGGEKAARRLPVVLAFHKMDLIERIGKSKSSSKIQTLIASLGYGKEVPEVIVLDIDVINRFESVIEADFSELIQFLRAESKTFTIVYTSCFGIVNDNRLGLFELLKSVLPK